MGAGAVLFIGGMGVVAALLVARRLLGARLPERGRRAPALDGGLGERVRGDVTLFFHSPTCGPCRSLHPHVEALVGEGVGVARVDVTEQPEVAATFGVLATPTTLVIRGGQVVATRVGGMSPAALRELATWPPSGKR